jgi:hypothetical protein
LARAGSSVASTLCAAALAAASAEVPGAASARLAYGV